MVKFVLLKNKEIRIYLSKEILSFSRYQLVFFALNSQIHLSLNSSLTGDEYCNLHRNNLLSG